MIYCVCLIKVVIVLAAAPSQRSKHLTCISKYTGTQRQKWQLIATQCNAKSSAQGSIPPDHRASQRNREVPTRSHTIQFPLKAQSGSRIKSAPPLHHTTFRGRADQPSGFSPWSERCRLSLTPTRACQLWRVFLQLH